MRECPDPLKWIRDAGQDYSAWRVAVGIGEYWHFQFGPRAPPELFTKVYPVSSDVLESSTNCYVDSQRESCPGRRVAVKSPRLCSCVQSLGGLDMRCRSIILGVGVWATLG